MNDLRKAAEMALEALCVGANDAVPNDIDERFEQAIQALRQALAEPNQEPVSYVPGFYCGEKVSLSRIKLGERFVLVRTGQIYSKRKDGYWNEMEERLARLHLNCQVQVIKEKNNG